MKNPVDGLYKWVLVIAAMYAVTCLTATAQGTDAAMKARLEQVAKPHTADHAFMGTVLVVKGNEVLLNKGYGIADMDWHIPNAPDVKFRIGSVTKQFTAALVLLLQEDGKLRIENPVSKYLPNAPETWKKITLANLLGHTSGIPNFTSDERFPEWSMSAHTHEEELAFFRDKPLDFAPGSKFEYSNSNYEVLGMVIEKVSGKSYGDMLRERILKPLHMVDTGLDSDERIVERHARGYRRGKDGLARARSESMTVPWAAGSIYSTTGDLLRWERGLFGGKVLSTASLKAMTTPGKGHYGLGVGIDERYGVKVISHNGGIEGFNAYLSYVPARKITVAVLSNVNGTAPDVMGGQLLKVVLGKKVVLASERKAIHLSAKALADYVGSYRLAPHFILTISRRGDQLYVHPTGQSVSKIFPSTKDEFFSKIVDAQFSFQRNAHGNVTSLVLHQNGADQRAPRVRK